MYAQFSTAADNSGISAAGSPDREGDALDKPAGASGPHTQRSPHDVLIIGGGIAGCATAYYLARAGVEAALVEKGDLASAASGVNAGSIHVQIPHADFVELGEGWAAAFAPTLPMLRDSASMWSALAAQLGANTGCEITGGVIAAASDAELAAVRRKTAIEHAHGIDVQMVDREELRALAPYVAAGAAGGAFSSAEGHADPLVATRAFADAAKRLGARIMTRQCVIGLEEEPDGYVASTPTARIRARRVVNAAGAEAGRIAAMLGIALPVEGHPIQLSVTERLAPFISRLTYSASGRLSLKQTSAGTCLIGGGWPARTRADGRLELSPTSLRANLRLAVEVAPALGAVRLVRSWPAVVPGTHDWRPLIGEVPGQRGFYVNFFPWMGFTAGPIAACTTAALVAGRKPPVDISRLSALT